MGLPIVPILHALTPLALKAIELYRKRSATQSDLNGLVAAGSDQPVTGELMARRLRELEESDLEQARLLSELTRQVEALAQTTAQEIDSTRRRDARTRALLGFIGLQALTALIVAVWVAS